MIEDGPNIICEDLTRYYGETRGIEGLDLTIEHGEIFGFLGPNGAGKTTTIRMLMGMLKPTRGKATVLGMDTWRDSTRIKLHAGNVPGDPRLYEHMRVNDLLNYIDDFRPGPDPLRAELLERLDLDVSKKVRSLSRGNRQKVAILLAMMHDPEILILDEPSTGLDPLMQQEFYTILGEFKSRNKTVFLSSHILSEVERVCDRVGIVKEGRLVDVRAIEDLRRNKVRHMDIAFSEKIDEDEFRKLPQVLQVTGTDNHIRVTMRGEVDSLIKLIARYSVEDLTFTQPSLEDFFMSFYGADKTGPDEALQKPENPEPGTEEGTT
ncbi:MAG: ABC transporter ATP-binding protein [Actinobacteria bacterium]|nr:ABC transporter ATP-binding protein [Actinomycetota bacterium]